MTRKRLKIYILLNILFLGAIGYRTWTVYQRIVREETPTPPVIPPMVVPPPVEPAPVPSTTTATTEVTPALPAASTETVTAAPMAAPEVSTGTVAPRSAAAPNPPSPAPSGAKLPVRFSYFNTKAKSVFITGSFNKWTPKPFRKTANETWSVVLEIAPGDYSYSFVVDGKTIRDPNQRRVDDQGRSLLTVSPPKQ